MGGVNLAGSIIWRSAAWYVLGYVSLVVVISITAVILLPLSVDIGYGWVTDPQDDAQRLAQWQSAAVMGVTAGSEVGYLCALVSGLLAARVRAKLRRGGLLTAVGAGAGLAVANVTVAWLAAAPRFHRERGVDNARAFIDPNLWHHGPVRVAMALVFIAFLIAASIGFGVTSVKPPVIKAVLVVVVLTVSAIFAPIAHVMLPPAVVP